MTHAPVTILTVWYEGTERGRIGRLASRDRRILFEYDPAFVTSGIEISPFELPLKPGVMESRRDLFDGLFGVFADSLPDGWGRLLLDRAVERRGIMRGQLGPLDRLAFVGRNGMGALSFEPDHSGEFTGEGQGGRKPIKGKKRDKNDDAESRISLDRIAEESRIVLTGDSEEVFDELLRLNGSSGGARPKIVAQVSADRKRIIHGEGPLAAGYEHWMIKFASSQDERDAGAIEYAYSLMAAAGLEAPPTHLFRTRRGGYFGVRRFDRDGDRRIHMHSLAGLIHADYRHPSLDYDTYLKTVMVLTRNMVEVEKAYERRKHSYEFEIGGKTTYWLGDANVYAWHRFQHMHGDTVECALMALEKWFYDEIDKGNSISEWVRYIYERGESAAFAGLLVSIGLRCPVLFLRDLQPLLGNFYVYECQMSLALNEQAETWVISLSREPQEAIKLAAEWNRMPHRQYLLRDVATSLMLENERTAQYLSARKAEWAKLRQGDRNERLNMEFFLARFDPANYTKTPQEDGRVLITMRWPDHLEKIAQKSQEKGRLKSLSLSLAMRARRMLEGQETLPPEDLSKFVALLQELAGWKGSGKEGLPEHYRINSIAGGLAVLVVKHRSWLSHNPDAEQWCMATLRELKPVEEEHFSPMAINDHTAEAFLGEAGVALLQESNEEWILRIAFEGVTGAHYASTLYTLWRAYLLREQLGGKFSELVNVMVLWSALRHAAGRESGPYSEETKGSAKFRAVLFQRYAAGRLAGPLIPLRRVEIMGRRLTKRIERRSISSEERQQREAHQKWVRERRDDHKLDREMPEIDLEVIQKGFGFLSLMVRQPQSGDEMLLRQYVQELFDLQLRTLPRPDPDDQRSEIQGTPYQSDAWIMGRVAEFIAHANSVETARGFYRPILELGPAGKYWVEDFLQCWISSGLQVSPDLHGFGKIWEDMVAYTETLPAWQPGEGNHWNRAETLAVDLMGLGQVGSPVLGDAKYQNLVSSMAPTFGRWGQRWLKFASAAAWFANFLRTESGRVLLPEGIKQLAAILDTLPDRDWYHHEIGSLFTDVLALCWKHLRSDVERDTDLRKAFLNILTVLCARQIPEAVHLRAKVSEVLGS